LVPFVALQADDMLTIPAGSTTTATTSTTTSATPSTVPTISYAPNATVFWHNLSARSAAGTLPSALTVGYNGIRQGKKLRYTEVEVECVAALLAGEAVVGGEAKKERLRQAVQDKAWIHFACHAWFNHELPLESYLQTGEDEQLTALEVMEAWQLRARLVTLSACQTGVSRVLRGDEPMGLVRSFLSAGAEAVLVTQWPVEDLPTCLLMLRFYQEVTTATTDLSRALLTAQRWLCTLTIAEAQEFAATFGINLTGDDLLAALARQLRPFEHPRFWAAFKLVMGS
jgi:CHAT domain-containing protein